MEFGSVALRLQYSAKWEGRKRRDRVAHGGNGGGHEGLKSSIGMS